MCYQAIAIQQGGAESKASASVITGVGNNYANVRIEYSTDMREGGAYVFCVCSWTVGNRKLSNKYIFASHGYHFEVCRIDMGLQRQQSFHNRDRWWYWIYTNCRHKRNNNGHSIFHRCDEIRETVGNARRICLPAYQCHSFNCSNMHPARLWWVCWRGQFFADRRFPIRPGNKHVVVVHTCRRQPA